MSYRVGDRVFVGGELAIVLDPPEHQYPAVLCLARDHTLRATARADTMHPAEIAARYWAVRWDDVGRSTPLATSREAWVQKKRSGYACRVVKVTRWRRAR